MLCVEKIAVFVCVVGKMAAASEKNKHQSHSRLVVHVVCVIMNKNIIMASFKG
jgi:hypothetical protein